jgi:hypothetical protein
VKTVAKPTKQVLLSQIRGPDAHFNLIVLSNPSLSILMACSTFAKRWQMPGIIHWETRLREHLTNEPGGFWVDDLRTYLMIAPIVNGSRSAAAAV